MRIDKCLLVILISSSVLLSCGGDSGGGGGGGAESEEDTTGGTAGGSTGGTSGGTSGGASGGTSNFDVILDSELTQAERISLNNSIDLLEKMKLDGSRIDGFSEIFGGNRSSNVIGLHG